MLSAVLLVTAASLFADLAVCIDETASLYAAPDLHADRIENLNPYQLMVVFPGSEISKRTWVQVKTSSTANGWVEGSAIANVLDLKGVDFERLKSSDTLSVIDLEFIIEFSENNELIRYFLRDTRINVKHLSEIGDISSRGFWPGKNSSAYSYLSYQYSDYTLFFLLSREDRIMDILVHAKHSENTRYVTGPIELNEKYFEPFMIVLINGPFVDGVCDAVENAFRIDLQKRQFSELSFSRIILYEQ